MSELRTQHLKVIAELEKNADAECLKYQMEFANAKIEIAQLMQSEQDLEDFVEIEKKRASKLEAQLREKEDDMISIKLDLNTAKAQIKQLLDEKIQTDLDKIKT